MAPTLFQSARPRARARLHGGVGYSLVGRFNPRALGRGRDAVAVADALAFVPVSIRAPSGEGATGVMRWVFFDANVSIRAPSGEGATSPAPRSRSYPRFQSARPRARARLPGLYGRPLSPSFQSARPRARARLGVRWLRDLQRAVSIRAPSGEGATLTGQLVGIYAAFQSARPRARARR